jgi:hypothetical protein
VAAVVSVTAEEAVAFTVTSDVAAAVGGGLLEPPAFVDRDSDDDQQQNARPNHQMATVDVHNHQQKQGGKNN